MTYLFSLEDSSDRAVPNHGVLQSVVKCIQRNLLSAVKHCGGRGVGMGGIAGYPIHRHIPSLGFCEWERTGWGLG